MVAQPANSININGGAGLVQFNGTATFSEVTPGDYGVLISSSTGVPSWLANGTTGQVLTATTSGTPSWAAAAGGGGITWSSEAISFNAVKSNGYFCTAGLTATLPASPSEGDTIAFICTATAVIIQANTGETIHVSSTTSSSAGTCTNVAVGDSITLVAFSSTVWYAYTSVGNWTLA